MHLRNPFLEHFANYNGEKLIIWRAELFTDNEIYSAVPGQVSKIDSNSQNITVITGSGKILIKEISYLGKRSKPFGVIKSIRKRLS